MSKTNMDIIEKPQKEKETTKQKINQLWKTTPHINCAYDNMDLDEYHQLYDMVLNGYNIVIQNDNNPIKDAQHCLQTHEYYDNI